VISFGVMLMAQTIITSNIDLGESKEKGQGLKGQKGRTNGFHSVDPLEHSVGPLESIYYKERGKREQKENMRKEIISWFNKYLRSLPDEMLTKKYARTHYQMFDDIRREFGGVRYDWYDALVTLGMPEDRIKKIKRLSLVMSKTKKGDLRRRNQMTEWFNKHLRNLPDEKLERSYAREHYKLFNDACKEYGANGNDWYAFLRAMGIPEDRIASMKRHFRFKNKFHKSKKFKDSDNMALDKELISWFRDSGLAERSARDLTIQKIKNEFPDQWVAMNKLYGNYGIALRRFGVSESEIQEILECSVDEDDDYLRMRRTYVKRREFALYLSEILEADPNMILGLLNSEDINIENKK